MEHSITQHIVSRETHLANDNLYQANSQQLDQFIDTLLWWNRRINLVSRDVPRETIVEHIRHSLLLSQFSSFQSADYIVDAGTGGGLPGIPLAIANPSKQLLLNDIVTKKVMAVKQMTRTLGLENIDTFDGSVADLAIERPYQLISKHAFKINKLLDLTHNHCWTSIMLYKGLPIEDELKDLKIPLQLDVYRLGENSKRDFYIDKAIVEIMK